MCCNNYSLYSILNNNNTNWMHLALYAIGLAKAMQEVEYD